MKLPASLIALFLSVVSLDAHPAGSLLPPGPESEFLSLRPEEPTVDFCSEWNPEFAHRGHRCCSDSYSRNIASRRARSVRHLKARCAPGRIKTFFCDEMTDEQRAYVEDVKTGRIKDPLKFLEAGFESKGQQAWCGASNGFLVGGRPLLMSPENRIELRNPARCANFGTDRLVAMMEWTGREVNKEFFEPEFSKARVIVGDLSAPKGSCISGRAGRRAHKSHTSGLDIDLAFFNPRFGHNPEERFTRTFYVASNWWFLKKVFKNPYACVKAVFLDGKHIKKLARFAKADPEWQKFSPYIRHIKGHKDHFHIRVGEVPGPAGCAGQGLEESDEEIADADTADSATEGESMDDGDEENQILPPGVASSTSETPETEKSLTRTIAQKTGEIVAGAIAKSADAAPDEFRLAHKREPSITQRIEAEMRPKRSKRVKRRLASQKRKIRR